MYRKVVDKSANQFIDLLIGSMEILLNTLQHDIQNQNDGKIHHLIYKFMLHPVKQIFNRAIVRISKTYHRKDHISYRNDYCVVSETL